MAKHLDKLGSFGAVLAAAACPICFPKLALLGGVLGLGAFSAYEAQLFIAAQALVSGAAIFAGLYCCVFCSYGSVGCRFRAARGDSAAA